jgi:hypothetical protein
MSESEREAEDAAVQMPPPPPPRRRRRLTYAQAYMHGKYFIKTNEIAI